MTKPYDEMTADERRQALADWQRSHPSTAEMAMARMFSSGLSDALPEDHVDHDGRVIRATLSADQRERREREINAAMRGVVEDGFKPNPVTGGPSLPTVTPWARCLFVRVRPATMVGATQGHCKCRAALWLKH
jgi:hypothetical protein